MKEKQKENAKMFLAATAAICMCTVVCNNLNKVILANEFNKPKNVLTQYDILNNTKDSIPIDNYKKFNYIIKLDKESATTNNSDITKEEAAELGIQNLWKLFGEDFNSKEVVMKYYPAGELQSRSIWTGEIKTDKMEYFFSIDSITGENYTALRNLNYDKNEPLIWNSMSPSEGYDRELEKNPSEYIKMAKDFVIKNNIISGNITSCEYYGQGYTNNDPIVDISVKTDKGQEVRLSYSRNSKNIMGVSYDKWVKEANEIEKKIEQEILNKDNYEEDNYEEFELIPIK